MKAVILAGGLGTRLKPFTEIIPKPLLPIGDKAILEIQIQRLKQAGVEEIFLATNYKSEYISNFIGDGSRYDVKIVVSKEKKPLGTAGPIKLLEKYLDQNFIVMNGDILSLINYKKFSQFSLKTKSILSLAVKKDILPYDFGNIFFEGDFVTGIEEKPNIELHILAGIYHMTPDIMRHIPENTYFGMDDLIKSLISHSNPISKYEMDEYWLDIGRVSDYESAEKDFKEKMNLFEQ
tara:strand:- start:581 stop:1285 length:705 start_codon:yes stop_codon:yes gene_type:complete